MRTETAHERGNAFLARILDRLSAKLSGKVRKRKVTEDLGRFSYASMLFGRFSLAAAAEEARVFIESSSAAGKAVVPLISELMNEVRPPRKGVGKSGEEGRKDVRARVADFLRSVDPEYRRLGPPLFRPPAKRFRRSDFRGRADTSTLTGLSIAFRGDDPADAVALLMSLEGRGLVAIGSDPFRKKGAMVIVSGSEAAFKVRSSKAVSSKVRRRIRAVKRPISAADAATAIRDVRVKLRYPVAYTLASTALIVASLSAMTFLTSFLIEKDFYERTEEINRRETERLASGVEEAFIAAVPKARFLISLGIDGVFVEEFFAANPEILYVGLEERVFFNGEKAAEWKLGEASERIRTNEASLLEKGAEELVVANVSPYFARPAALIVSPYREIGEWHPLTIVVDTTNLVAKLCSGDRGRSFVADGKGELILHPDVSALIGERKSADGAIIDSILRSGTLRGSGPYHDSTGAEFLGEFRRTDFLSFYAVSVSPQDAAFLTSDTLRRFNLALMAAILVLALLFTVRYASLVNRRLLLLMAASSRSRPVPSVFASDAKKTPLRGGERRVAAVLFSEFRGFAALTERLESEAAVELLNEYLNTFSGCVEKTGGIVEKYGGDTVSAVWGVPASTGRDSSAAVDAALLMRAALESVNKSRSTSRHPPIRIGSAIHVGPVLAGRIEVGQRTEYAMFGGTTKLAAHLEALTRRFGVDILVSEAVRVELEAVYRLAVLPRVIVSERSRPQHVYAVLGRYDDPTGPRSFTELRARLGHPAKGSSAS